MRIYTYNFITNCLFFLVQVVVTQVSSLKFAVGYIINLKPYLHLQRVRRIELVKNLQMVL